MTETNLSEGATEREAEFAEREAPKSDDTFTFRRSHFYITLVPLAFVLGLSVGFLFWGRGGGAEDPVAAEAAPAQAAASNAGQNVTRYDVPVDDDPALGPADAPITIIEFSDFECPYCRKWHEEVFDRLMADYSGQIRFVYRDFPLASIHGNATSAAEAAECAGEQGAYWEYHAKLFSGQYGLGSQAYAQYAEDLGLNVSALEKCLESGRFQAEVQSDFEYAAQLGVRSTPTFFINGLAVVGAQPYEVFQRVIEQELAGAIQ